MSDDEDKSQIGDPRFAGIVVLLLLCTVMVVFWLRKVYTRLETTVGLPIEYGLVTTVSILGGLSVYQEYEALTWLDLVTMGSGMGCIVVGIALTVWSKTNEVSAVAEEKKDPLPLDSDKTKLQEELQKQHKRNRSRRSVTAMGKVTRFASAIRFPGAVKDRPSFRRNAKSTKKGKAGKVGTSVDKADATPIAPAATATTDEGSLL